MGGGVDVSEILDYIMKNGWEHKPSGNQYNIKVCPVCHDTNWHFYIHKETGQWKCHNGGCNQSGNLYSLQKMSGDLPAIVRMQDIMPEEKKYKNITQLAYSKQHQDLLGNKKAMDYLMSRGFRVETIKYFSLGYFMKGGKEYVSFPAKRNNEFVNAKYRQLPPCGKHERFTQITGAMQILFNEDGIIDGDEAIVAESETGAIILWQNGFRNVASVTGGASNFRAEWIGKFAGKKKIYLAYDMDEAGQKGAGKAAEVLGEGRCYRISLDFEKESGLKDVNDYFVVAGKTRADFQKIMELAMPFKDNHVFSMKEGMKKLEKKLMSADVDGDYIDFTPWQNVNQLLSKIKKGNLIVLLAPAKTGKTTLALNIAAHNAKRMPVLFYCMEMLQEDILLKMIQSEMEVTEDGITADTLSEFKNREIFRRPFYFGYNSQYIQHTTMIMALEEAINNYNIKLMVFDNLHAICRDTKNPTAEITAVSGMFKQLAMRTEIPIILICQPRKTEHNAILTSEDAKGSGAIITDADIVTSIWRKKEVSKKEDIARGEIMDDDTQSPVTLFKVLDSRYSKTGERLLYYRGEHSKFTLMDKSQQYMTR